MDLSKILSENCIQIGGNFSNKIDVLKYLAKLAKKNTVLDKISEEDVFQGFLEREKLGTTGFEKGIAIPHCAFDGISDFIVGMLILPEGVNFESIDKKKTKLFIFIILPKSKRNLHIQLLSKISNVLRIESNVREVLAIKDAGAAREYLLTQTFVDEKKEGKKDYNLFHVIVQDEDKFDDVLNVFMEIKDAAVSVIESNNGSSYLNSLPLFSSLWNNEEKGFNRIVVAVIKKSLSNEAIRKINILIDARQNNPGIMMFVQEVFYTNGSLNL